LSSGDHGQAYWPQLIAKDPRFDRLGIYLGGYYTAIDAGGYEIRNAADELLNALRRRELEGPTVLTRQRIIFVCHSTGGIVVRYILVNNYHIFAEKVVGLVLIASPSYGSEWASRLSWLTALYGHSVGKQLSSGHWTLSDLDAQFKNLVGEHRIPKLCGIEGYENHFILHRKWLPDRHVIVPKESAGRYFRAPIMLRDTDHFSSVKPTDRDHPAYQLLVDFYQLHFQDNDAQPSSEGAKLTSVPSKLDASSKHEPPKIVTNDWPPENIVGLLRTIDGTPITPALVPIQLIRAVAEACTDKAEALMVVQQAEGWLLDAGEIKPGVLLRLDPQFLGDVRENPLNYWLQTFNRAATRGARVLVALLAALPPTVLASQRDLIARTLNAAKTDLGQSITRQA
jgi:hypothetical protein